MNKLLTLLALAATLTSANAGTFYANGVLYGTVCRNGPYWTSYPAQNAQPVGSSCPVRDSYGNIIGYGTVTSE